MARFTYFLGFALPLAIASDIGPDAPRDEQPSPGRCCLCKRFKEDTFLLTPEERVCADDIAGIVHRSGARRIVTTPRSVFPIPEEVAKNNYERVGLDDWWDQQFERPR